MKKTVTFIYTSLLNQHIMAQQSVFRGVLVFFEKLGVYDVILPFLLVFTMVFAILEKTKIFGMEKIGKEEYTKKSLNAMVAFAIAFIVVASSKLVAIINEIAANMVVLLAMGIFFLMLVGALVIERKEGFGLDKGWQTLFMVIMFIGILIITLRAIPGPDDRPLLDFIIDYIMNHFTETAVSSIIFIIAIALLIGYITKESKPPKKEEKKEAT